MAGGGMAGGGMAGGGGGRGRVMLYDEYEFGGNSLAVDGMVANFGRGGFNDRAHSLVVFEGSWELCDNSDFGGPCQIYGPGRYGNLGALSGRVSSIRPSAGGGDGGGWNGGGGGNWGSRARAILYESPNMGGRSFVIDNEVASNLGNTGFNDRASSLRIEGGYWVFCTDANFQGECRTFGPGDYPTLPWDLNNRISSGRRVHGNYPYNGNPNWGG
jgi:hypothetical protein